MVLVFSCSRHEGCLRLDLTSLLKKTNLGFTHKLFAVGLVILGWINPLVRIPKGTTFWTYHQVPYLRFKLKPR